MKLRRNIAILILCMLSVFGYSQKVKRTKADKVCKSAIKILKHQSGEYSIADCKTIGNGSDTLIYIFNLSPQGFVLVAGNEKAHPVLGYSFSSSINIDQLPEGLSNMIDHYKGQIATAEKRTSSVNEQTSSQWDAYSEGIVTYRKKRGGSVLPLLKTAWNQDEYNQKYPEFVVGCVALAMGQVMRYHEFPQHGFGKKARYTGEYMMEANFSDRIYNYANMPHLVNANTSSIEKDEVKEFLSHCGIAADMDYGILGSGADDSDCEAALKNYFGYNAVLREKRDYVQSEWIDLLEEQLDQSNPVLYYGTHSKLGPHAFVIDGYEYNSGYTEPHFHFDFGWGTLGNGNYLIDAIVLTSHPYGYFKDPFSAVFASPANLNADFIPNNFIASVNESVSFRDNSIYRGSGTLSYSWNFGDGQTSTAQNPVHTYNSRGFYTVSLTVNDGAESKTCDYVINIRDGVFEIYADDAVSSYEAGNGTKSSPFRLDRAINEADDGDRVILLDGVYRGFSSPLQINNKSIEIASEFALDNYSSDHIENTIIENNFAVTNQHIDNSIKFKGLTIKDALNVFSTETKTGACNIEFDNIIFNSLSSGIDLKKSKCVLRNCVFYDIRYNPIRININGWYIVENCIFYNNGEDIVKNIKDYHVAYEINYSNIRGDWEGQGLINTNPQFVNPLGNDFHLQSSSPCAQTGANGIDMGAYGYFENCSAYNPSYTLAYNETWGVNTPNKKMYSKIIIPSGRTLTINAPIEICSTAEIEVQSGGKLIIANNGKLIIDKKDAGGNFWDGIIGDGEFEMYKISTIEIK